MWIGFKPDARIAIDFSIAHHRVECAKVVLEAIISIATNDRQGEVYTQAELESELASIVERTRPEAQEIMVHTFDFLYFHASDPRYYITSIWHSWCAIPGIRDRIPEYLLRTMCAVSSTLLRNPPKSRFLAALHDVKRELASLAPKIDFTDNYVEQSLALIEKIEQNGEIYRSFERAYGVRMRLVRLVHIFLYSDVLAARLFSDPHRGGGEGYRSKKALFYDLRPIGNALQFLRVQLKATPTEAESMWVLHALAFDITPPPLESS